MLKESVMWRTAFTLILYFTNGLCSIWTKGVVHFAINNKDYDIHSQDVIQTTFADIEREICVKFFNSPPSYNASVDNKILYITNPDKRKNCPPSNYNFSASVVDMPIGYKCIDPKNIARVVVDMLRASIDQTVQTINSNDLIRKFQEMQEDPTRPFLLTPKDRNYINAHYHSECGALVSHTPDTRRVFAEVGLSRVNADYYNNILWPYGLVMYQIYEELRDSPYAAQLQYAMMSIELATCVVFQEVRAEDTQVITPKNMLYFTGAGADAPEYGFKEGKQTISLDSMIEGAPGHTAHTLNLLLRSLGVPMVSNRPDRDNYITVHWNHVIKGKEFYLEKYPIEGWVRDSRLPYDFESVTHAPANYMCADCTKGHATVTPAHDHLWQRIMSIGHHRELSTGDKELINVLYSDKCRERQTAQK